MKWTNYGDVNPIEHGGIWIAKDEESGSDTCYYIVSWQPLEEIGLLSDAYIDLSDTWFNMTTVADYADLTLGSTPEDKVRAIVDYYGAVNCNGTETYMNLLELYKELADREIMNTQCVCGVVDCLEHKTGVFE